MGNIRSLIVWLLFLGPVLAFSQKQTLNQVTNDPKKNNEMLIGYCDRYGFASINSNFDSIYRIEYRNYLPNEATLKLLSEKLKDVRITLVMATWCSDSKDWVPIFYKTLDALDYNYKNLIVICVDRERKAPGTNVDNLKIEKIPTFIFYGGETELGRIVEVPADIFEKDMLRILK